MGILLILSIATQIESAGQTRKDPTLKNLSQRYKQFILVASVIVRRGDLLIEMIITLQRKSVSMKKRKTLDMRSGQDEPPVIHS